MLPSGGFYPGHDKMDLPYSFGMRPDVVVTLYETSGDVRTALVNGQTGAATLGRATKPHA